MSEELIIDRSKWYRGQLQDSALLRKADGKMCCLGFECLRRGLTTTQILERGTPEDAVDGPDMLVKLVGLVYESDSDDENDHCVGCDTDVTNNLVEVNDDTSISDEEREKQITGLFAEIGVTVKFIN